MFIKFYTEKVDNAWISPEGIGKGVFDIELKQKFLYVFGHIIHIFVLSKMKYWLMVINIILKISSHTYKCK